MLTWSWFNSREGMIHWANRSKRRPFVACGVVHVASRETMFDHPSRRVTTTRRFTCITRRAGYVADLKKGMRITGTARDKLAADLKKKYEKGASIRALAESTGRSYGFVHRVLSESGVTLRGRGGATRTKKK